MTGAGFADTNPIIRHRLAACTALALIVSLQPGLAERDPLACAPIGAGLPADCVHDDPGMVVARDAPPHAPHEPAGDLGDLGFSISIEPAAAAPPRTIAGTAAAPAPAADRLPALDQDLERLGLRVSVDGLGARPILNVSTADMRSRYRPGQAVAFRSVSNYPGWIARAEIIVTDPDRPGHPIAVLPARPNGLTEWTMPADGPAMLLYVLRVHDRSGHYDETAPLPLTRASAPPEEPDLTGPIMAAGEGEDRTARRGIPVRGALVTISGADLPAGARLTVLGEQVTADASRRFVHQRILPPGEHELDNGMGGRSRTRHVTVPRRELFATGIAEITVGRDGATDENWRHGRIAGFVHGVLADGTRLTASVDTRDTELRDIFSHATRRFPDQVLRQIEDREVWATTGDDSTAENLAPTSGRLFLRLENDQSQAMWGDFRPDGDLDRMVRSDRTLYGASAGWHSPETAADGSPRAGISAYAASTDRLSQRDVFRGTGGSSYFLSHRDIESGTETLLIELRDPVSNRIVLSRRLVEGRDYRIDPVQGVVILSAPLSPSASGPGLVGDSALGDLIVNLVVQYDHVPAHGAGSGDSRGARAETWLTRHLRFGATLALDGAGGADNRLGGADLLWKRNEDSWLSAELAESRGPGLGQTLSLTGGLDLDPASPVAGSAGLRARGTHVEGRLDLAEIGGAGHVAGFWDRRDAGFSAPDWNVTVGQRSAGLDGRVGIGPATVLTFGATRLRDDAGRRDDRARIGIDHRLSRHWQIEAELAHRDRVDAASPAAGQNGKGADAAARLTWHRDDDFSAWIFGQAGLARAGDLHRDDRLGLGAEAALADRLRASAEVSQGTQGVAGQAQLSWAASAASSYTLGWREDPTQTANLASGERRGLVFGAQRQVNNAWAYTTETVRSGVSSRRSLAATHGVSYTPDERWRHDAGLLTGRVLEADGTTTRRSGLSLGTQFSNGEDQAAKLRTEWRRERSDDPLRQVRRESWLAAGEFTWRTDDDWRVVGGLDVAISQGEDDLRDGRYVEAMLGYAYRPVASDRPNALLSYTYLQDLPGADQVNIDGDTDGPRQCSHILNAAFNYELDRRWTLGGKYGLRTRRQADRDGSNPVRSTAHLAVLRADYRIVHRWDAMAEFRVLHAPRAATTEYGALLAVYREITPNARIGLGYAWGGVSDDLRSVEPARRGLFVNLIGKF